MRIDFLRGAALLVITLDHIPGNRLARLTPLAWGLSDMAEVFVFLSGFVSAASAGRAIETTGWRSAFLKFLRRVLVLYVAYVATGTLLVMLVRRLGAGPFVGQISDSLLLAPPSQVPILVATVQEKVSHLCILLLYLVLLSGLVPVLWLTRRSPVLLVGSSLALYVAVQVVPHELRLPQPGAGAMYYNPAAWQVVFLSGAALALMKPERRRGIFEHPAVRWAAFAVLAGVVLLTAGEQPLSATGRSKTNLGPLRMAHFGMLVVIGYNLLPRDPMVWRRPLLREITLCGRQSLAVYCGGALLAVLAGPFAGRALAVNGDLGRTIFCWIGAWCVAVATARMKAAIRTRAGFKSCSRGL